MTVSIWLFRAMKSRCQGKPRLDPFPAAFTVS